MSFQIWLGDRTVDEVVDQLTTHARTLAPDLDPVSCRAVIDLAFRSRVRQTTACGEAAACRPDGPMWDTGASPVAAGETCAWVDRDPQSLPAMLAAVVADQVRAGSEGSRRALEPELTMAFRGVFSRIMFRNRRCGHAAVCSAEPVYPFTRVGRDESR